MPFRAHFAGHSVRTATQQGWDRLQNGALLDAAEAGGFDMFVTSDQNIKYQQNLSRRRIGIAVLLNPQWPSLRIHAVKAAAAITGMTPGGYLEFGER